MLLPLFLLFTVVPIVEITLLVKIGSQVGVIPTLLLVIGTGIAGAWLARWQGVRVLARIQHRLARGQMPNDELIDGALVLVAGVLLVTPGVLTDVMGLVLLIPPCRSVVKRLVAAWARKHVQVRVHSTAWPTASSVDDDVVEGEVVRRPRELGGESR